MRTENQQAAFDRWNGRCVLCHCPATEVHEIIPRSRDKNWDRLDNEVPLCRGCHFIVHGNMTIYIERLQEIVEEYHEEI